MKVILENKNKMTNESQKIAEKKLSNIEDMIAILEKAESSMEYFYEQNPPPKEIRQEINYSSEFGYKFLARIDSNFATLLKANDQTRSIDIKKLNKVRKRYSEIGDLLSHLETECFSHFKRGKTHFIHGDPAIWNYRSIENEIMLSDWETCYFDAKPQHSLWILLTSVLPNPEERIKVQDRLIEFAYKKRYNVLDITEEHQKELRDFKLIYNRIDLYQSIIQIMRHVDRYRGAISEEKFEKAKQEKFLAKRTYDHAAHIMQMPNHNLQEMHESLDNCIEYLFQTQDHIDDLKIFDLYTEKHRSKAVAEAIGLQDFEKDAQKEQKKEQRRNNWIKKIKNAALPVTAAIMLLVGAVGIHSALKLDNLQEEVIAAAHYVKGHEPTKRLPYRLAQDAPFNLEDAIIDDEPLDFLRSSHATIGEESKLTLMFNKKTLDSKFHRLEVSIYQNGKKHLLGSPKHFFNMPKKDGKQTFPYKIPRNLNEGKAKLEIRIDNFDNNLFTAHYPIELKTKKPEDFVQCFYDNVSLSKFYLDKNTVTTPGEFVTITPEIHFSNPNISCMRPFTGGNLKSVLEISDGTTIISDLRKSQETLLVPCKPTSKHCHKGKTYAPGAITFEIHGNSPAFQVKKLVGNEKELEINLYISTGDTNTKIWLAYSKIRAKDPRKFDKPWGPGVVLGYTDTLPSPPLHQKKIKQARINSRIGCFEKKQLVTRIGKKSTLAFECSNYNPGKKPITAKFRAYIPELGITSDVVTIQGIKPYDENKGQPEPKFFPFTLDLPINIKQQNTPGLYNIIIEYSVDDDIQTFTTSLTDSKLIRLVRNENFEDIPSKPISSFVTNAAKNPKKVVCYHNKSDPQGFYGCIETLRTIKRQARGKHEFIYVDQIESQHRYSKAPRFRTGEYSIFLGDCTITPTDRFFKISEKFKFPEKTTDLNLAEGLITYLDLGNKQVLLMCNGNIQSNHLTSILDNLDDYKPNSVAISTRGKDLKYEAFIWTKEPK